jgi:MFS transporter, ACS family, solute carrier family 17 (sodium-dependent inorganic phosphate cotransporter), other
VWPWGRHGTVDSCCIAAGAVFISYIDRTNISIGAIAMKAQLGWTETPKGSRAVLVLHRLHRANAREWYPRQPPRGKLVLGVAVVWWSLFTALTPPAALLSLPALVGARIALGLGEAAVFPASINMIARFVPVLYRSRAVALLTSTIPWARCSRCRWGWPLRNYGWPVPFYAFGALGLLWAVIWFAGVRGGYGVEPPAPTAHPAIPWGKLLRWPAVWAIVVGHFVNWSFCVLLAWLPSYFKTTFGVSH